MTYASRIPPTQMNFIKVAYPNLHAPFIWTYATKSSWSHQPASSLLVFVDSQPLVLGGRFLSLPDESPGRFRLLLDEPQPEFEVVRLLLFAEDEPQSEFEVCRELLVLEDKPQSE